ncbi:pre-mRNA-processing factor 19 homolog 1-like [Drosophila obscura]|uniref:pre-mRNA-processing factor 19 homolog 1-like n=1 Tax=Drosophila obscura TaxID=7282 RepID=UPI001BB1A95C|nr:pre-mRNA-processing factor 19 homolog 1-like [Drosophila obscura]XP_022227341.2 pre-mRNA-processing factor 19 homolog 1-like [Drosophila obscura]
MSTESKNNEPNYYDRLVLYYELEYEDKYVIKDFISMCARSGNGIHTSANKNKPGTLDVHSGEVTEHTSSDAKSSDSNGSESDDSYEEDSDSEDDPNEVKVPYKGRTKPYKDFFEGNALYFPKKLVKHPVFTPFDVYLDYKQIFVEMQKIVEEAPNHFKYDISAVLYPVLVLGYLRMVIGGNFKMAKQFLLEHEDYLEDIYDRSIAKLKRIRRPKQVSGRAQELLFGDDLVLIEMPKAALMKLLEYMAKWTLAHQELFVAHIVIDGFDKNTPKRLRLPLGRPPIEEISWANLTHTTNSNPQAEPRNNKMSSSFLSPPQLHPKDEVICAFFLKDGCWLGMASTDYTVRLVSVKLNKTVKLLNVLVGHLGKVYTGDISPDRRFLISCSLDGTMRLWCLVFGACMGIYNQISPVRSVVFAPVGNYFATASVDGLARVWINNCDEPILLISGHLAELEVCIFHPNGRYLATGSADLTVRMWDVVSRGEQVRLFYGHYQAVTALAFSRSGRYLVSGGRDSIFVVWDTTDERPIRSLLNHKAPISTIDFAMDDSRLALGCQGTYLSIWNFDNILKSEKSRDTPILILSHPNRGGPIFKTRFVKCGVLISICSQPPKEHQNSFGRALQPKKKTGKGTKQKS